MKWFSKHSCILFATSFDFTRHLMLSNNYVAAFSSSILSPHTLARINYSALVNRSGGSYVFAEDDINSDLMNRTREYFGPVDIRKLHFQILDEYGRVVDLNNMDWSCTLTFDVLYD